MSIVPKIRFFLLAASLALTLSCCSKEEYDPIPDVYVRFQIDLNDIEFNALGALGNSITITSKTNNYGSRAAGYNYNGILVYRSLYDDYHAFDRTCPHCFVANDTSVAITTEKSYSLTAECPSCGTSYSLDNDGMPTAGPGKYYLKNYKTQLSGGRYLLVWNKAK